jgi:nucleoside-diphosphate-sugar epimerase
MSKTVIVTGASGFIGYNLIAELCKYERYKVYAITSGKKAVSFPEAVSIIKTNLLDDTRIQNIFDECQPDVLIHLVWDQNTPDFFNSASNCVWLEVSLRLLRLFRQAGGKELIFSGSSAQYDNDNGLRREYTDNSARSLYGECKNAFEEIAKTFCCKNNIRFVSCRLFTVFGKGDTHTLSGALPSAIQAFMRNEIFVCRNPNNYRDYIHINDVSRSILAILECDYVGPVNIASGIPRCMKDIFEFIAQNMHTEHLFRIENTVSTAGVLVADTTVLRDKIGFKCSVDFGNALVEEIEWLRNAYAEK